MTNKTDKTRRAIAATLGAAAVTLTLAAAPLAAVAQTKPTLKVLVGFPPGAGTDTVARIYAEALNERANVAAVVENRVGAGGLLANQALKAATADAPAVMVTVDHQVVMLPFVTKNPGFDAKKDFVPVGRLVMFNACLAVNAASPATTLQGWIDRVRANVKEGSYGVAAPGSQAQFVGFVVGRHYNVQTTVVPFKGAAPAINDLLGNQVPAVIVPCDALNEHRKAGKIRVLAVAADQRTTLMPDVPTFAELGVKMPTDNFIAVYANAGMRPELLRQVQDATRAMFANPRLVERLNATGLTPAYGAPDELGRVLDRALSFWGEQVRLSNFQAE